MAKKQKAEAGKLPAEHLSLLSKCMDELEKVYVLGNMLSLNEREDIAFAGRVISGVLKEVRRELSQATWPDYYAHQDQDIPF